MQYQYYESDLESGDILIEPDSQYDTNMSAAEEIKPKEQGLFRP